MKRDCSRQIFEKKLKYQVSSKSFQLEPSCSMRMHGYEKANNCFSQFCELAQKEQKISPIS